MDFKEISKHIEYSEEWEKVGLGNPSIKTAVVVVDIITKKNVLEGQLVTSIIRQDMTNNETDEEIKIKLCKLLEEFLLSWLGKRKGFGGHKGYFLIKDLKPCTNYYRRI